MDSERVVGRGWQAEAAWRLYRRLLVAEWVDEFCDELERRERVA